MGLFRTPLPDAPGPKARPSAVRESDTIQAVGETRSILQRLINLLSPYQPKQITDANGARVQVLAVDLGNSPVDESESDHPFKVFRRNNGTPTTPIWQSKVSLNSDLLRSLQATDRQTITGLDTWFTLLATDLIWLSITVSSFAATAATIMSTGQGHSGYTPSALGFASGGYVEASDNGSFFSAQTIARLMIAQAMPDVDGNPVIYQKCRTNLVMRNIAVSNLGGFRAAIYPLPSPAGFYA